MKGCIRHFLALVVIKMLAHLYGKKSNGNVFFFFSFCYHCCYNRSPKYYSFFVPRNVHFELSDLQRHSQNTLATTCLSGEQEAGRSGGGARWPSPASSSSASFSSGSRECQQRWRASASSPARRRRARELAGTCNETEQLFSSSSSFPFFFFFSFFLLHLLFHPLRLLLFFLFHFCSPFSCFFSYS